MANSKKVKAMATKLNKSGALKEKIDLKQKAADLEEEFMSAVEECEDNKTLKKVPKDVIKFYETLAEAIAEAEKEAEGGDDADAGSEDEATGKAAAEEALGEAEDMDDLKAIVKEHELDVKIKKASKFKATKKLVAAEIEEMEDEDEDAGSDEGTNPKAAAEEALGEAEDIDDLKAIVAEHELDVKIKKVSKFKATKKLVAAEIEEMEDEDAGSEDEATGKAAAEEALEEAEDVADLKAIVAEHELDVKIKKASKFKATKKLVAAEIEEMPDAAEDEDKKDKKKPSFRRGKGGYTREQSVCDVLLKGKAVLRKDLGKLANAMYVKKDGSDNVKQSNTIAGRALRYLEGINVITEKKGKITLTTE